MQSSKEEFLQQTFVSAVITGLLHYLGIVAVPIIILIVAMIIDYVTGMLSAWLNAELSSKKGIKGIVKKVSYLALVAVAMIVDWLICCGLQQINVDIKYTVFFAVLVAVWLIINELISVLENLAKMGVPIPNFLKKLINRLKNTVDESEREDKNYVQKDKN